MPYPKVTSLINLKGGVGKTTLCVNLAYGLAYFARKRVLLVDLDPQANATQYLISQAAYRKRYLGEPPEKLSVFELFEEVRHEGLSGKPKPIEEPERFLQRVFTGNEGSLDLVASKLELSLLSFMEGHAQNDHIRVLLQTVAEQYDYVFIDCPPTVSRMLMAAFEASQWFLVPMKPEFLSTIGLPLLAEIVTNLYGERVGKRKLSEPLKAAGIVYTMVNDQLTMTQESVTEINREAAKLGYPVFKAHLSASTKFAWSSKNTLPIFRTEPRSRYAQEVYEVVEEFLKHV